MRTNSTALESRNTSVMARIDKHMKVNTMHQRLRSSQRPPTLRRRGPAKHAACDPDGLKQNGPEGPLYFTSRENRGDQPPLVAASLTGVATGVAAAPPSSSTEADDSRHWRLVTTPLVRAVLLKRISCAHFSVAVPLFST
jgi:hypothetical protein